MYSRPPSVYAVQKCVNLKARYPPFSPFSLPLFSFIFLSFFLLLPSLTSFPSSHLSFSPSFCFPFPLLTLLFSLPFFCFPSAYLSYLLPSSLHLFPPSVPSLSSPLTDSSLSPQHQSTSRQSTLTGLQSSVHQSTGTVHQSTATSATSGPPTEDLPPPLPPEPEDMFK